MRILLTGAAGFIGSTIADQLIPAAHGSQRPDWAMPDLIVGDVRDQTLVADLLDDVDVVCHQAAMVGLGVHATDAPDYVSHNVAGTASLLSAMARRGVHRLVLASSMVVYGEGGYRCMVDGPTVRYAPGRVPQPTWRMDASTHHALPVDGHLTGLPSPSRRRLIRETPTPQRNSPRSIWRMPGLSRFPGR